MMKKESKNRVGYQKVEILEGLKRKPFMYQESYKLILNIFICLGLD
jgi:hypothetical protein